MEHSEHFADRLVAAVRRAGSPVCVGIDPMPDMMPDDLRADGLDLAEELDGIFEFCMRVLRVIEGKAGVVKLQSAYFERYHSAGIDAYFSLIQEASESGFVVIGDVKRGDIGSTSAAYAQGHLIDPPAGDDDEIRTPDAITVNPFCGLDTLEPFASTALDQDKGLFVLVRTSNPGSAALQDQRLASGLTWSEHLADLLRPMTETPGMIGPVSGMSRIGAVVGATQMHTMQSLRARLPRCTLLLPGYGTQGATADMTRAAFVDGTGALVSASRSILYAYRDARYASASNWEAATEAALDDMRADLRAVLGA